MQKFRYRLLREGGLLKAYPRAKETHIYKLVVLLSTWNDSFSLVPVFGFYELQGRLHNCGGKELETCTSDNISSPA